MEAMQIKQTQKKADKWWSTLSPTEKATSLMAAGTIDIGVAGAYIGRNYLGLRNLKQGM